jgi:Fic family protein
VRHRQGRLLGRMESLGFDLRQEAILRALTADVVKSSEIEGQRLDTAQVRSSIARRLGMEIGALQPADRHVEGIVEMVLDATGRHDRPLTAERLFAWHAALFPTGGSGMRKIRGGAWRDDSTGPMQVVSGPVGRGRVHFVAPPSPRLERDMEALLDWFNRPADIDEVLKAGLSHLWFVTVHPFTAWMDWFLGCLGRAIDGAEAIVGAVLVKARFWERVRGVPLNERQMLVLNRLLDGFEGKLTTSKYARLTKSSQDTALRDILFLVERGILVRGLEGGRSTSYALANAP